MFGPKWTSSSQSGQNQTFSTRQKSALFNLDGSVKADHDGKYL